MSNSRAIQICGTGSGVGKSVIVTALCRIFLQDGYKVCPFKAQNMALNSYVTKDGGEIGRAQATQAKAAKIEPTVDMNPILIKPSSDRKAQIIVKGRPIRNMSVYEYVNYKKRAKEIVLKSFQQLAGKYELVVIEGAGSPAEINLRSHDIVNMQMARVANAPVILVGDIDKGGVFAWIVGTLELLTKQERKIIKGIIINKFRGDKRLLRKAIEFLEKKTNIKVLGVIPYFSAAGGSASGGKDIRIPEEDSVPLKYKVERTGYKKDDEKIHIGVIKLPHISNFTDFDALENEEDTRLSYIESIDQLEGVDVIIIPGTKNTIEDLLWLRRARLADKIISTISYKPSTTLIGICGGYQMLGRVILDLEGIESTQNQIQGLGLLPIKTTFKVEKVLSQTQATQIKTGIKVSGYEIHHGRTISLGSYSPMFKIIKGNRLDGFWFNNGRIWGTYLHGIFDNVIFRRRFLNQIRNIIGLRSLSINKELYNLEDEFDKLAKLVRKNINMQLLYKILNYKL